jgi:hypothetical protein
MGNFLAVRMNASVLEIYKLHACSWLGVKIQGSDLCLNDVTLTEEGNLFPTCRVYFVSIDHSSIIVQKVEIIHQDVTWSAS